VEDTTSLNESIRQIGQKAGRPLISPLNPKQLDYFFLGMT